jgi:alkylhydroperoxidase family enzyme
MRNKKVLIGDKVYAALLKDARTKGMTPEEIVELLLRRQYKML